jgi:hypothetical protein
MEEKMATSISQHTGNGTTPVSAHHGVSNTNDDSGAAYTEISGHSGGAATPVDAHSGVTGYTEVKAN